MTQNADQIRKAIEIAQQDNDDELVEYLNQQLESAPDYKAPAEQTPVRTPSALERFAYSPMGTGGGLPYGAGGPALMDAETDAPIRNEEDGKRLENFARGTGGALAYGSVRLPGAIAENVEADYDQLEGFQQFLINEALPDAERSRLASRAAEKYGSNHEYAKDPSKMPPGEIKSILDENPENKKVYDSIKGNEWWEERKEFFSRGLAKLSGAFNYGQPAASFGADDPRGALTGRESYQIEERDPVTGEVITPGIRYDDGKAPAYGGASVDLRDWMDRAESGPSVYEGLVMPLTEKVSGRTPGELISEGAEKLKEKIYTPEQYEGSKGYILNPEVEITDFSSFLEALEGGRLADPMQAWMLFNENAVELGLSFAVTRGFGGIGARAAMKSSQGQTLRTANALREKAAKNYSMIAGGATEGMIVQQHVEKETRDILMDIPLETYEQNSESFNQMVAAGVTPEAARQIEAQSRASQAGNTAAVVTMLTGAPLNRAMGLSGAGRLAEKSPTLRRTGIAVGEPLTEGLQEVMEMLQTEAAVRPIDPDNPIFANPNRYLEAGIAGAAISAPFGIAGALEPSTPKGIEKEDADAVKAGAEFARATNERFKFEAKIADPKHIERTAPIKRLEELEKLEGLQLKEANAILDNQDKIRAYIQKEGGLTAPTELKMLSRLVMRARAMKSDIEVARSRRTTAAQLQQEEQAVIQERARLQEMVENETIRLEDLEAGYQAIEQVQSQMDISAEQERDLIRDGYLKRSGAENNLIVTPKGRRAVKEMRRQARALRSKLEAGYTGEERRQTENLTKRQLIDEMDPATREEQLYSDPQTDVQNRRAFNERQENIDVREGETKRQIDDAAPVVAAVDLDSLKWANDNMGHAAGDRMLVAVADAISAQPGVEVYRLGGDEFAVTGQSEGAVEEALQNAVKNLESNPVVAGNDEITPTITWGKGRTYDEADAEGVQRKQERIRRGVASERGKKPASYRVRSQQGLFQMDSDTPLAKGWPQVRNRVQRGDVVEILSPDGASFGTILKKTNDRGRPRLTISVDGRVYRFNPDKNWLIVDPMMDPDDLAYISGDQDYADPDRETFPQTLSDVQIGHIGDSQGNWYADLAADWDEYQSPLPWYLDDSYKPQQAEFVPDIEVASAEDIARTQAVIDQVTNGYNLPPGTVKVLTSTKDLERTAPEIVGQIIAELNGGSFRGVRGYMDHINHTGVYIFPAHIKRIVGDQMFEQGVAETVIHELVGHYGVRGFFGNEPDLRNFMNEIVDAFPGLANYYSKSLGLNKAIPDQKQLLGEEMVAYIAGEVDSGKIKFNEKQKGIWRRLLDWIKDWLQRRGWNRWSPVKVRGKSILDTKEEFWNDERIQELLHRSHDFLRSGKRFEFAKIGGSVAPQMRDGEIFKAGILTAIDTATVTVPKNQRKNEAKQRGVPLDEIPAEKPLFPERASPNAYKQAVIAADKEGYMSALEARLTGLADDSDWNLFKDATYGYLGGLHKQYINNGVTDHTWYKHVLPPQLAQELDDIYQAMRDQYMVGPLPQYGDERARPVKSPNAIEAMNNRILDIMAMRVDPKKTMLNRDLLRAHVQSEKGFTVTVEPDEGYPSISYQTAMYRLFGDLSPEEVNALTEEDKKMIEDEVARTKQLGYDIGYDEDQQRWIDFYAGGTGYSGYAPAGTRLDGDYRVMLVKTKGQVGEIATSGLHYDPNLMHIRTGTAKLLDYDGKPQFDLSEINPANRDKVLAMIELQTDQLQKNRRGFASQDERLEAEREMMGLKTMLQAQAKDFSNNVSTRVMQAFEQLGKPIANLPSSMDSPSRGSLFSALDERAIQNYSAPWERLTDSQRQEVWSQETSNQITRMESVIQQAHAHVEVRIDKLTDETKGMYSLDARQFERLDKMAVLRVMRGLGYDLDRLRLRVADLRMANSQKELADTLNNLLQNPVRELVNSLSNDDQINTRLPMTDYLLGDELAEVFELLNLERQAAYDSVEALKKRDVLTVRIPRESLLDYVTAANQNEYQSPQSLLNEVLANSYLSENGINPFDMSFKLNEIGDFFDITISGKKGLINEVAEKLPELIERKAKGRGPILWQEAKQRQLRHARHQQRRNLSIQDRDTDYTYEELEDLFSLEEFDVMGEQTEELLSEAVESYQSFDQMVRDEYYSEEYDSWIQNIDWDTEAGGEFSRDNDEYRSRLIIDDDGDVDNSDAEEWLEGSRSDYIDEYGPDEVNSAVDDRIAQEWERRGPTALIIGSMPVEWDEDREPTDYVQVMIRAQDPGDVYDIYINGDEMDYGSTLDEAKNLLSKAVAEWFNSEDDYEPPPGFPFSLNSQASEVPEAIEAIESMTQPNWDIVAGNLSSSVQAMGDDSKDMKDAFERMVTLQKRYDSRDVAPDHPLSKDELWRPIALKYLISDAVRRGMGGIIWNNGMASATRGGMGLADVIRVNQLSWSKETMTIRGQEQEVYVINSPDISEPVVATRDKLVPILGIDATRMINMQEKGKVPTGYESMQQQEGDPEQLDLIDSDEDGLENQYRGYYLISQTQNGYMAVHRRTDHEFIGFATDQNSADSMMQSDFDRYRQDIMTDMGQDRQMDEQDREGVLARGIIKTEDVGGALAVVAGSTRRRGYSHTYKIPRLGGARQSYEDITVRLWNKELKKYGTYIQETYIDTLGDDTLAYRDEVQPALIENKRQQQIEQQHGSLSVVELTGDTHGWVIMSEKAGVVVEQVFTSRRYAERELADYIDRSYGIEKRGIKTFFIPINEKMREEFSGPVAPFHYDPEKDPDLKEFSDWIDPKPSKKTWRERWAGFKYAIKEEMFQSGLDRGYGLRRALMMAGLSDDAYIDFRLSTSLDSLMKGVVEYGHPVWEDGVVTNKGRGLAEVLGPIMDQPEVWGRYMTGKRARKLMLDGMDALTPEKRAEVQKVANDYFDGDVFEMIAWAEAFAEDPSKMQRPAARPDIYIEPQPYSNFDQREITRLEFEINELRELAKYDPADRNYEDHEGRRITYREAIAERDSRMEKLIAMSERSDPPSDKFMRSMRNKIAGLDEQLNPEAAIAGKQRELANIKNKDQYQGRWKKRKDRADKPWAKRDKTMALKPALDQIVENGRHRPFKTKGIRAAIALGKKYPAFERVAADYADFNKKMLDFAEASGIINAETRPTWEHADYVPFYRVVDERVHGGFNANAGIANQRSPIVRLRGKEDIAVGDIINNIFMNTTKLMDASVKNNAARNAVDSLLGTGFIVKQPKGFGAELIEASQLKKIFKDAGIEPDTVPREAFEGFRKLFALKAPEGPGVISILRDGKREYYRTDNDLLWRSMGAINMKRFGNWIQFFTGPKRFVTEMITIDPGFVARNLNRDTGSSFVVGRDWVPPIIGAAKGFGDALLEGEDIRTLTGAGAAFENGYINANDPNATKRLLRRVTKVKQKGLKRILGTVVDTVPNMYRAWRHVTSAAENANRVAVYRAALAAGKSKKRAIYEAKDLMDFSMGGDARVIQFLIQTVPFMNARIQGNYRLARGAKENPVGFFIRGLALGLASWMLYMKFRDDERYKELPMWAKQTYYHWWWGGEHYSMPKPFEVGAIFSTIPELFTEAFMNDADDATKELLQNIRFMLTETFSLSPVPQTFQPLIELGFNYNFFTGRPIVSFYEDKRLPPEQYSYKTSPAMVELARAMPRGLDVMGLDRLRSPKHLQNLYYGYTGTIGRYMLMGADSMVRMAKSYPAPPAWEDRDWPLWGSFIRGDHPARNTKYEAEVYKLLDRVTSIQGSLNFLEKTEQYDRQDMIDDRDAPYIDIAPELEAAREQIRDINNIIMEIHLDPKMTSEQKTKEIDVWERERNAVFKDAFELRPGGKFNPILPDKKGADPENVRSLIEDFGVDDSQAYRRRLEEESPSTAELLELLETDMSYASLRSLAKAGGE